MHDDLPSGQIATTQPPQIVAWVTRPSARTDSARLVLLSLFGLVLLWNIFQADQSHLAFASGPRAQFVNVNPAAANVVLASLDQYTPLIAESTVDLTETLRSEQDAGFVRALDSDQPFVTEPTKLEVAYTVAEGDSITGIADAFGLHVATIAERNEISVDEIEHLKPGDVLMIPPVDTSDSTEWLVKLNEKKEAERQRALAEAARRRSEIARRSTSRVAGGFGRAAGMNFVVPIGHNGISRGLSSYHMGIDYRADTGTGVKAAQEGRVVETTGGWSGGFGISVLVDHGGGLTTRYAHLSRIAVSAGQVVAQGQVIGYSGNTGYSTGPHLHFETRSGGRAVNPF